MLQTIVLMAIGAFVLGTLIWQWRDAVLAERGPATTSLQAPDFLPRTPSLRHSAPARRRVRAMPRVGGTPRRIHSFRAQRRFAA
jgi:hypothetical protein